VIKTNKQIVSSQAVPELSSFSMDTDISQLSFQIIHTMDLSVSGLRSGLFGGHRLGARKFDVS